MYSLRSIIETSPDSLVKIVHESEQKFYAQFENNFLILPDGKTIIGVESSTYKGLIMEDITQRSPVKIGVHSNYIRTVFYDQFSKTLFAGDENGHVIQYQRCEESGSFHLLKDYGNVGVGRIFCSAQVGGLAVFGGSNTYSIMAIDISQQTVVQGCVETAIRYIDSMQFCRVSRECNLLSVGGRNASFSESSLNIFEVKLLNNKRFKFLESSLEGSCKSKHKDALNKDFGWNSQILLDVILSSIKVYIKGLFQNFEKLCINQFKNQKSRFFIYKFMKRWEKWISKSRSYTKNRKNH